MIGWRGPGSGRLGARGGPDGVQVDQHGAPGRLREGLAPAEIGTGGRGSGGRATPSRRSSRGRVRRRCSRRAGSRSAARPAWARSSRQAEAHLATASRGAAAQGERAGGAHRAGKLTTRWPEAWARAGIGAVWPAGQVTLPAARSMRKSRLLSRPSSEAPSGTGASTSTRPRGQRVAGGLVAVGRVAQEAPGAQVPGLLVDEGGGVAAVPIAARAHLHGGDEGGVGRPAAWILSPSKRTAPDLRPWRISGSTTERMRPGATPRRRRGTSSWSTTRS